MFLRSSRSPRITGFDPRSVNHSLNEHLMFCVCLITTLVYLFVLVLKVEVDFLMNLFERGMKTELENFMR